MAITFSLVYAPSFSLRTAREGEDAVAVAVDVALIVGLARHDSLELDIVWWHVDAVTEPGGLSLLKKKRWDYLRISISWTTIVFTAKGSIEFQYGGYLLIIMSALLI